MSMGPSTEETSFEVLLAKSIPTLTVTAPPSTTPSRELPPASKHCSPSVELETIEEHPTTTNCSSLVLRLPPDRNSEQSTDSSPEGLNKLKRMTARLRLCTRRASYIEWCNNLPNMKDVNGNSTLKRCGCDEDAEAEPTADDCGERLTAMEENIKWLRNELREMESQDHRLAVQLMRIRTEIQKLKLQESCREHKELIDTATEYAQVDREEEHQQPALCDPPFRENGLLFALEKPLKGFGVTKLNLFARRFSLC